MSEFTHETETTTHATAPESMAGGLGETLTSDLSQAAADQAQTERHPIPNWLRQVERVLRVLVRLYLGLLVCFAPWYPQAWDENPLFSQPASLHHFTTMGAVRGVVSGLGLLNLWIALSESIHSSTDPE
jgi:hypothetical protein